MENFLPPHEILEIFDTIPLSQTIGWGIADLNIPELWKETEGENVRIAIIDTGIGDPTHYELQKSINLSLYKSFVPGEQWDKNGHGTGVSGVIGAENNQVGIVGCSPKSELVCIKCIPDSGGFSDISYLNNSLEYALSIDPDVVNMSLGSYTRYGKYTEMLIQKFYDRNIVVCCANGNISTKPICFPAAYPNVIGVSSYKKGRLISSFSPKGDVDFCLPGEAVVTTALDDKYAVVSGSSFSSPFMAGIIALMISSYKKRGLTYTVDSIIEKLRTKCIKVDNNDKHSQFGYGIINMKDLN